MSPTRCPCCSTCHTGRGPTGPASRLTGSAPPRVRQPVILAGSLDPGNVAAAIATARPWAVDTARGVESSPGVKDHDLVRAFVRTAKEAP